MNLINKNNNLLLQNDFFLKKIKDDDISYIYLVFDKNYLDISSKRYVYEYFDKDCFKRKKINEISVKFYFNNCKDN